MQLDTIVCGDCLDVMRDMPDGSVDLVVTDPPYGDINHINRLHERAKYKNGPIRKLHKGMADTVNFDWDKMLSELDRVSSQWIYIFAGDKTGYTRSYYSERNCMTRYGAWEKTNPTPLHGQYIWLSSIELFAIIRKHHGTFNYFCKSPVLRFPNGSSREHPTQKPLELIEELILSSSNPGDLVFDPFLGSGTTAVAALKLGRHFYGCDINQTYVDLANQRIEKTRLELSQMELALQCS